MKNKGYMRFYSLNKFLDDTDFLEWRGIKKGGMFIVNIKGIASQRKDWKLSQAKRMVKLNYWIMVKI